MEFEAKKSVKNPYTKANIISKAFFLWIVPIFFQGAHKTLQLEDLYDPLKEDISSTLGDTLEKNWRKELAKSKSKPTYKPSLLQALFASIGTHYLITWIPLGFVECCLKVSQTIFLRLLIVSFSDPDATQRDQYLYAAGVTLSTFITTVIFYPILYELYKIAARCRVACSSLVYRKALRLSKASQGQTTVGQITNILSNDVNRFDQNLIFIPYIIFGPLQALVFFYFIWQEFGVSTFAGFSVVVILIPVQYWNGTLSTKFRRQIAVRTDERSRLMNELIMAMRVIKMYAWEKPFSEMVDKIRRSEVKALRKRSYLRGIYLSIYSSASKVVPFLTFLCFVLLDNQLTAQKVFFLVACFNYIIQSMTYIIPSGVSGIGEIRVSLSRIQEFLLLEEKESKTENNYAASDVGSVTLDDFTASWNGEGPHLKDIHLNVSGNQVVCVVGSVASGKTTFLHALLEELKVISGRCNVKGRISYASQEPWIFAGNIRQNILFGRPFDSARYEKVTRAAALIDDFIQLPHGEMTIVGDRGVSLSGGQKARINLARALYQEAEIYLLDDPLSAVDTKVSRHLFEKCVRSHLDGHLRILVTHQLQYLPQADYIVVLQEGKILTQGTYESIVDEGIDFISLMSGDESGDAAGRKISVVREYDSTNKAVEDTAQNEDEGPEGHAESMAEGSINLAVYWDYFRTAQANFSFVLLVISFLFTQIAISFAEYWLSFWTNAEKKNDEGDTDKYWGQTNYLLVYGLATAVVVLGNLIRALGFFTYCMKISVNMHNWMFSSLVRSPTKFFDDNPSGRVMNRFTKDLGSMDELLPPTFFDMLIILLQMLGVVAIVIVSNYYMAIPAFVVVVLLFLLRKYYIITARAVKRIEGITKSPVFTHSSATFQGLTTIRAAKAEMKLIEQFDGYQDIHSAAWFLFFSTARCFGVWVELISIVFLAIVTFGFLILQNTSMGGNIGLAVSSAMSLTGWFQYGMRQSAEVENLMTSVERTLEYAKLKPEAPLESTSDKKPPKDWPDKGAIQFQSVYLAYEEKEVLKDLTFDIKPQEKIGIVGRTGAGKSSIIQALFRMTEPRGNIFIDGILVNEIGLHDLRQSISIIPQDPVLFSGTMRYNLDPFGQYEDADLWNALEDVELKSSVSDLDCIVADGGTNFSVGQRQLVCLARAIVRKNKIIVMDEATANVDPRTDNFIQKTIRSKFAACSIITIAHRLHSVIDCDRILVLDNGFLKEYDHPYKLLQDPSGILTSMVNHTGKSSRNLLLKIAQETFHGKRASFDAHSLAELQLKEE